MFALKNVTKMINKTEILNIPELEIREGEICCISGPNGAGKTTLLEIMAGLQAPSSGSVMFLQKPILETNRQAIAMVLQNSVMFNTTVFNNIVFGLKATGVSGTQYESKVKKSLEMVDLQGFEKRQARSLSGGEQQRIAIARALVLSPKVLILDEPVAGLDTQSRLAVMDIIKKINRDLAMTFIIASHDTDFLLAVATTAFSLFSGRQAPIAVENLFHGRVLSSEAVEVNRGIKIYVNTQKKGKINLVIPPQSVVLSTKQMDSSMRNRFNGSVTKLVQEGRMAKVWVDIGIEVCALITQKSIKKMRITLGDRLWLEFKATSVKTY